MLVVTQNADEVVAQRDGAKIAVVPISKRSELLASLEPSDEELTSLDERWDGGEGEDDSGDEWTRPPLLGSATVDGHPWGWSYLNDRWRLLPSGKGDLIAEVRGGFEGSMTGVVLEGAIVRRGACAFLCASDDCGGLDAWDISYGADDWAPSDWDELLIQLSREAAAEMDHPICLLCEEDGDWSFFFTGSVPPCTEAGQESAIANIWQPCSDHAGVQVLLDDVAGCDWQWNERKWQRLRTEGA